MSKLVKEHPVKFQRMYVCGECNHRVMCSVCVQGQGVLLRGYCLPRFISHDNGANRVLPAPDCRRRNRDVVLDGSRTSDGQSTTVWQHAEYAWRCRDLFLEFVRRSDVYMVALEIIRQEAKMVRSHSWQATLQQKT